MEREALKLALEVLMANEFSLVEVGKNKNGLHVQTCGAITAINAALAQPAQEPVAWQWLGSAHFRKKLPKNADITAWNPLYTAPPQPAQEPFGWYSAQEDEFMTNKIRKEHERLNSYTHINGKFNLPLYSAELMEKTND